MPGIGHDQAHHSPGPTSDMGQSLPKWAVHPMSAFPPIATKQPTSGHVSKGPTAEARRFTQSPRQREPAAMVAPYDRVGFAVRGPVVLSIPAHDQRWRVFGTTPPRYA